MPMLKFDIKFDLNEVVYFLEDGRIWEARVVARSYRNSVDGRNFGFGLPHACYVLDSGHTKDQDQLFTTIYGLTAWLEKNVIDTGSRVVKDNQ